MHRHLFKIVVLWLCLLPASTIRSQTFQTGLDINNLLNDAIWYTDAFFTPATDAAIYQASSGWVATPQQKKLWDVNVSVHTNVFFVPKANRKFTIRNSDFSFFTIENQASATVPTGLGNDDQVSLVGYIDDGVNQNEVRLKTPEGINMETVVYPYLQASMGIGRGLEVVAKYSSNVKLKKGDYQVYGAGVKYNLSQYLKAMQAKNVYLSTFLGYSKEEITFDFLNASTEQYGSLGINKITGLIDTWQMQVNASKKWNHFEAMAGVITNASNIKYEVAGETTFAPIQSYLNVRLSEIYKKKINSIGELSGRYQFNHFFTQANFSFGKFANVNISVQYEL